MTTSALEAATTTRVDCGAAVSEKALTQARQATRTNERIAEVCRAGIMSRGTGATLQDTPK
eukprot:scaffold39923_cov64-Phaeocystis_antarctica.AAC.7